MGFVIHWHESAMDLHVFSIPIPPPTSLSTRSLWVFPVHQAPMSKLITGHSVYLFLTKLGLCCCMAFPLLWEGAALHSLCGGSLVATRGLCMGSVLVAHGLGCSAAYRTFPGIKPASPALAGGFLLLDHREAPGVCISDQFLGMPLVWHSLEVTALNMCRSGAISSIFTCFFFPLKFTLHTIS